MSLFQLGEFRGASGILLPYKIECDALDINDLECIVSLAVKRLPSFSAVIGVPRGGIRVANVFRRYVQTKRIYYELGVDDPVLIVDDVWTTGGSMQKYAKHFDNWIGFVIFNRSGTKLPENVHAFSDICM